MKTRMKFNVMIALGGMAFLVMLGERSEGASLWGFLAIKAAAVAILIWVSRLLTRMHERGEIDLDEEV